MKTMEDIAMACGEFTAKYARYIKMSKWPDLQPPEEQAKYAQDIDRVIGEATLAWNKQNWKRTALHLRDVIRVIGNELDIVKE